MYNIGNTIYFKHLGLTSQMESKELPQYYNRKFILERQNLPPLLVDLDFGSILIVKEGK